MKDLFTNTSKFPTALDKFPNCADAGSELANQLGLAYSTMWASHYNVVADFINKLQPLVNSDSASTDGTIHKTSYVWSFEFSMDQLIRTFSSDGYQLGLTPPTNVYPFEFMITTSSVNYVPLTEYGPNYVPLTFITNPVTLSDTFNGFPILECDPLVSVSVGRNTGLSVLGTSRWITNAYAILNSDTILIRGCVLDTQPLTIGSTNYPSIGSNFNGGTDFMLYFSLLGIL